MSLKVVPLRESDVDRPEAVGKFAVIKLNSRDQMSGYLTIQGRVRLAGVLLAFPPSDMALFDTIGATANAITRYEAWRTAEQAKPIEDREEPWCRRCVALLARIKELKRGL